MKGSQIDPPSPEKTTFKNPSLIRIETFLKEGWGKPYLPPSKAEFYSKN